MEWIIGLIVLWILGAIFGGSKDSETSNYKPEETIAPKKKSDHSASQPKQVKEVEFTQKKIKKLATKHPHLNKGQPTTQKPKQPSEYEVNTEINSFLNQIELEEDVTSSFKNDWKMVETIFLNNGIKHLYHFTDQANIPSIKKMGGLYSWKELGNLGVHIPAQGGSDFSKRLDSYKNLEDYVRLSFVEKTPMLYVSQNDGRIRNPVLLKIDPKVAFLNDTLYSDGNATANRAEIGGGFQDFKKINFSVINNGRWDGDDEKHYWQAEVMVKKFIPLKFIKNLP